MTTVKQLLEVKGNTIWTVRPDDSVLDAIKMMAEKNVGSLAVMDGDKLVGVVTERSYARNVILKGRKSSETTVRDVMKKDITKVSPSQSVNECMLIVNNERARYLPVISEGRLVGIISIGDLLHSIIAEQEDTIGSLENFIYEDVNPYRHKGEA